MSTLEHYGTLFPTAVVGSLPRPAFVREMVTGERVTSEERRTRVMDDAVAYAVRLQEEAGLDILSDGEWRRASYIGVIAELAHGFEVGRHEDGRPWTVVVDLLSAKEPGCLAAEARFLKRNTHRKIKVALPSPALLGERLWDAERSKKAYPRRRDFARACVPFLRRELELLSQAGAEVVQIDDPHLCLLVDPQVRAQYPDPEEEARFSVALINELVAGVQGVRLAVHLCRRAGARVRGEACHTGGYEPLIPHLNQLDVHHLTMEFTSPGAGEARVFAHLREDFEIGLGCVSVHPGKVDTPEAIAVRVEQALEFLPAERVVLNPDCGFAPGSAARVDIEEVYAKLSNQSEAARRLRERHA
ncbi:MAG: cobalamin-independent methionine synthase II family protein [Candidatus Handelsmanbacteria bacterium]|nr:cobalamin-independent methionine synthase II family protein [Candidatus Handelsmanbacteria bacterium]